jgi:hypothetical protein
MSPGDLAELVLRQRDILSSAARLVKPGGRLVYATCSLLREENEDQAEGFLAGNPDFAPVPAARAWEETIGGPCPVSDGPTGEDYLRLTPARHGTDGFFLAIFERSGEAKDPHLTPALSAPGGGEGEPDAPQLPSPPVTGEREGTHRASDGEGEVSDAADPESAS